MRDPASVALDRICHALADATRRAIWARLGSHPGSTTAELASASPSITRWTVMKHLAVLRDAGLIQTLPEGRARRHYRDPRALAPLRDWLGATP
jgi:DNA-binding transcriptional ArsR family regulator